MLAQGIAVTSPVLMVELGAVNSSGLDTARMPDDKTVGKGGIGADSRPSGGSVQDIHGVQFCTRAALKGKLRW